MPSRRRFLSIAASCAVLGATPARLVLAATAIQPTVWKGVAMGALASMTLVHPDRRHARAMIERCMAEVDRLETIFSLYRPDSALSRLNAAGVLDNPPTELVELLSFALALAERTDGAFDPTVQPLMRAYVEHFSQPGADPSGPPADALATARQRVGFADVELASHRIRLSRPGAAITLNGVAQGFITDRVTELLRNEGFDNVLVNLGEGRALGHRADGQPWRAGVADPAAPDQILFELPLGQGQDALATSGGYGTRFGSAPSLHHLLDPRTGRSANHIASVTVAAPRATLADGLSTALALVPPASRAPLLADYPVARAWLVDHHGHITPPAAIVGAA